ncbi:putative FeS cluster assembly scaffold IscU [Candidatus Zinderia insecticola CARI]|uniref:Putative FeS cluster assembly scaffold IscU n=1 Tax=Zinderia insecticola (strain CARI) TaxID=871271 RepID=E0TIS5_ZINIC|nr:putative FeS cluster assembly scaffold IscU [Candidatus Zinderia insecticola CARI]
MTFYSKKLIKYCEKPKNIGSFLKNNRKIGTGITGSPSCGDVMKLQIKIYKGIIKNIRFKTYGCGSAIASSYLTTKIIKNRTIEETLLIKNLDIANFLLLSPIKIHCSILAEEVIKFSIKNYYYKNNYKYDY